MNIGEKIKTLRTKMGLNQGALGEKIGVSIKTVLRWEKGRQKPREDYIHKLASALGVSVGYLMGSDGAGDSVRVEPNVLRVPVMSSMNNVCGRNGFDLSEVEADIERYELVPEAWLSGRPLKPYPPYIVYVEGESMEPIIRDGERVLVNPNETELVHDKVFVVKQNGSVKVRKVILQRDGGLILRAYNQAYKDDVIPHEDVEYTFETCGRVIRYLGIDRPAE